MRQHIRASLWDVVTLSADGGKGASCDHSGGDDGHGSSHGSGQGSSGNDVITANGNRLTLKGKGGNDTLTASGSFNDLNGGDGNDTLTARGEHNELDGGAGNDTLTASGSFNDLNGGDGNDTLTTRGEHNELNGGAGNDTLTAIGSFNDLSGGGGNDILAVTGSFNQLWGGDGNDTLTATGEHNDLRGGAGNDILAVTGSFNQLRGNGGNDTLTALGGSHNELFGGDGNDTLVSTGTQAEMMGGGGNDTFVVTAPSGNVIHGGDGFDTVTYAGPQAVSVNLREHGATLVGSKHDKDVLIKIENVTGGSGNDVITGDDGANVLSGGAGNDTLDGGGGKDTLIGGGGDDILSGGAGNDVFVGLDGTDRIDGGCGTDSLVLIGNVADYQFSRSGSTWTVSDDAGNSAALSGVESIQLGDRTIWLDGRNNAPILAGPLSAASDEDASPTSVNLLAGARDVDGNPLSVVQLSQTGGRNVAYSLGPAGRLILDPAQFNGLAAGMAETLTFTYRVSDGATSVPQNLTLTIEGRNDAPMITGINGVSASDHVGGSGNAVAADPDQGAVLTYHLWDGTQAVDSLTTAHGTITIDPATGIYTFTPNTEAISLGLGQSAGDAFQVVARDDLGAFSSPATVVVSITGTNDLPVLSVALSGGIGQNGGFYTADLLAGASDVDNGTTLSVVGLTQTGGPSAVFGLDGSGFSLDPAQFASLAEGETATLVFGYTVSDGQGGSVPQSLTVVVTGSNDAPIVSGALSGGIGQTGGLYTADLLAGASDVDNGTTLSVVGLTQTGGPGAVFGLDGSGFSLDPAQFASLAEGETATLVFGYTVSDGQGGSVPQSLTVVVTGSNDAPTVSGALSGGIGQNGGLYTADLLAGASDVDNGATLSVVGLTQTGGPSAVFGLDGSGFSLDPAQFASLAEGETATLVFGYTVSDGQGGSVPQSLAVVVTGSNHTPIVAEPLTVNTGEDAPPLSIDLLSGVSDVDASDILSVVNLVQTGGRSASFSISGTSLGLDPSQFNDLAVGETAKLTFAYQVEDGRGATVTQSLTVTVAGFNDAPVVTAVSGGAGQEDTVITGQVLVSDVDHDDVLSFSLAADGGPTHGSVTVNTDGRYAYTPASNYNGTDSFTVKIMDSYGGMVTQLVSIVATPVNDAPILTTPNQITVMQDALAAIPGISVSDLDGGSVAVFISAIHGVINLESMQGLTIMYGAQNTSTIMVRGSLTDVNAAISALTYRPNSSYFGGDNLKMSVADLANGGGSPLSTGFFMPITVQPSNHSPLAVGETLSGWAGIAESYSQVQLLANDSDPDGDALQIISVGDARHGAVSLDQNGNVIFTAESGYSGLASFSYTVSDGRGGTASATATVNARTVTQSSGVGTSLVTGSEIQVNTFTNGEQSSPSVAVLADGGHVVVWQSASQDGNGYGVYGRRYDAAGNPMTGEFLVNTYTVGNQYTPVVSALADGGFVVSWESAGTDGNLNGIFQQRYDGQCNPLGEEGCVNTYRTNDQRFVSSCGLADGGWINTWSSYGQDGSIWGVYLQRYAANGMMVEGESRVNTVTADVQGYSDVTPLADGGWVITWMSNLQDGSGYGIYFQRYDVNGKKSGGETQANTFAANDQTYPSVTTLKDGGWVVAWTSSGLGGAAAGIHAQMYNADGSKRGTETHLNTWTNIDQSTVDVAATADGGWVATWQSNMGATSIYDIKGQRFDKNGSLIGQEFTVNTTISANQTAPAMAMRSDGGFVVVWSSNVQDGSGLGIESRVYAAATDAPILSTVDGVIGWGMSMAASALFDVGHIQGVAGIKGGLEQLSLYEFRDDASMGGSGYFTLDGVRQATGTVVAVMVTELGRVRWVGGDGLGTDTYSVRAFDGSRWSDWTSGHMRTTAVSSSLVTGNETQVNSYISGGQSAPSVAVLADGGHVVVWQSASQDGNGYGVYGRRYDAAGNPMTGEFLVNTYTVGNQYTPVVSALADGGFVVSWESAGTDGNLNGIFQQRYDGQCNPLGEEGCVNTYWSNDQRFVSSCGLADGGWINTWSSYGQDGSIWGVYLQRYATNGMMVEGESRVNTVTADVQGYSDVTPLADGGWVITWMSNLQDGSGYGIYFQRYDVNGKKSGGETQANTFATNDQTYPSVTTLKDGGWVVAWTSSGQEWSGTGIYAQIYNADGSKRGAETHLNTYTSSDQFSVDVAATADGGWVATWQSNMGATSIYDIKGQRFDKNGSLIGQEFTVNTTISANQTAPATAMRSDGGFVVVWNSNGQNGPGFGIESQVYTAGFQSQGIYEGTAGADILFGSSGNDTLSGRSGADTYIVGAGSGVDRIDNTGEAADGDKILFGSGIATDQLWFQQSANDLKVSVIGTGDSVTVSGWFTNGTNHVATLQTADGHILTDSAVQNLVNAMATLTPPPIGQTTLTGLQHQQLDAVIAANWH